ncbi:MAG: acetyl-CoA C-acetyltransferase [Christensenella sp.]|uniref:acetyl-CoA C-acetyltransferase n=1 Tax=Christensenella sp. TaxID=1935934 RepID=UPI002B216053|nr:acetyl-CoA C-acetyltransferase [Christensenella sp.]MEA5002336.1 acetyl-CoA C-acetyltransferase [Christensenella sp.]
MQDVYIMNSCRTAIGSFGGSLKSVSAIELAATVVRSLLGKAILPAGQVDQVIMGNVLQAGQGQNPARQAMIAAGLPVEVPALTINKVCGSGLTSLNLAAALIRSGQADCIIAGGFENMSQAPHAAHMRWGHKMGNIDFMDLMIHDGLWDAFHDYHMGITAENVAQKYGITREEQDAFALTSQQKAHEAQRSGRFREEIVPVEVSLPRKAPYLFENDEYIRGDASLESLGKLRPAFQKDGTVTAGNASGINDGAAALLLVSEKFLRENYLQPQAKWLGSGSVGVSPAYMGMGPVPSVQKALKNTDLQISDLHLVEANEAFASQALAVTRELGLPQDIVNVNGGAIALGHPIGASGARIAVTLLHEMQRRDAKRGLATLCIGGGMGEATIFELCE